MKDLLIGICTFGNLPFTQLLVESLFATVKTPFDLFFIVGKPGDIETIHWLESELRVLYRSHSENFGFPYALNDLYDFWRKSTCRYLVIAGNDTVAYPFAIDSLVQVACETDYTCVSAVQYDVRSLVKEFPHTGQFFRGNHYIFEDFAAKPWLAFRNYSHEIDVIDQSITDLHNMCLFKKEILDRVGYVDVNFYPAYFEDNDYYQRLLRTGIRFCMVRNARFFHFWSRTIHQENGGSTHRFFERNRDFYRVKWGGAVNEEKYDRPFNGKRWGLKVGLILEPDVNIQSREQELEIVRYWRTLGSH